MIEPSGLDSSGCIRLIGAVVAQAINDQVEHLKKRHSCGRCEGGYGQGSHHCCYRNTCNHQFQAAQAFLFKRRYLEQFVEHYKIGLDVTSLRARALKLVRARTVARDTTEV